MKKNNQHTKRIESIHGDCDLCGEHSVMLKDGVCQKSACRNKAGEDNTCKACGRYSYSLIGGICGSHVCHRLVEEGKVLRSDLNCDDWMGC